MSSTVDRHTLVRQVNQRRVLETILAHGPTSRVEVSMITGLSKPTVNLLVQDLVDSGVVMENGRSTGSVGRSAQLYSVDPLAAVVIGIDLGGTKVRVAVSDLFGEILAEQMEPTSRDGGAAVLEQLDHLARSLADRVDVPWDKVVTVGLSAPGVLDVESDHVGLAFNIPGFADVSLTSDLEATLDAEVIVDNDLNLAAVGEHWKGLAAGVSNFAFIGIGTGFGMGLVVNGDLIHGSRGAAGEIAYLPIGVDLFGDPSARQRGALEEAAAASGIEAAFASLVERGGPSTLREGATVAEIFSAAAAGDAIAREVVEREARLVAQAILAVAAVADPELIVLGGGIGSNPALLGPVREFVDEIAPFPIRVETSALGDRASVVGAVAVGVQRTRERLFNEGGDDE